MDDILFGLDDPICTITLNRPERRNAVDGPAAARLNAAFERFAANASFGIAMPDRLVFATDAQKHATDTADFVLEALDQGKLTLCFVWG